LDFVETRFDQDGHGPCAQRERRGLLGALETRGHGHLNVQAGDLRSEPACLLAPALRERDWAMEIAADEPGGVGG
jgi:hypothetical protein